MLIISYDIKNNKLRTRFSKGIQQHGAIRLQYSVYEVENTKRVLDNLTTYIEEIYKDQFTADDSVIIFDVNSVKLKKYGNALHRDKDIVFI